MILLELVKQEICSSCVSVTGGFCRRCDLQEDLSESLLTEESSKTFYEIVSTLVKVCQEQKSPRPRVAAMLTVDRFFMHTARFDHLDLKLSPIAQWTLQSLKSSVRDLRIASVFVTSNRGLSHPLICCRKAASNLLVDRLPVKCLKQNRMQTFDALRSLSDRGDLPLQETCVLALGCFARYVSRAKDVATAHSIQTCLGRG